MTKYLVQNVEFTGKIHNKCARTADKCRKMEMKFAGNMIEMGKEYGIPVPYCEYTYHLIKAMEEKNDGKFEY